MRCCRRSWVVAFGGHWRSGVGPSDHSRIWGRQRRPLVGGRAYAGRNAEPTVSLLRRLTAALEADVRLTPGHDLGSVGFETHAA